jgi:hypothetical protein
LTELYLKKSCKESIWSGQMPVQKVCGIDSFGMLRFSCFFR